MWQHCRACSKAMLQAIIWAARVPVRVLDSMKSNWTDTHAVNVCIVDICCRQVDAALVLWQETTTLTVETMYHARFHVILSDVKTISRINRWFLYLCRQRFSVSFERLRMSGWIGFEWKRRHDKCSKWASESDGWRNATSWAISSMWYLCFAN